MKTFIVCLALCALPLLAQEQSFYHAREFSVEAFGQVATPDFDRERTAAGFGASFFPYRNFGIGLSTYFEDLNGQFLDNVALKGIYRIPINKSAPYVFAGGLRHFQADEWGLTLGGGIEHRFRPHFGVFAEIGMEKFVDHDALAIGKIGVRIPFGGQ